jgi:hypothetical protein
MLKGRMFGHVPISVQYRPTLDTNAIVFYFIFLLYDSAFMLLSLMGHTNSSNVYKLYINITH